LSQRELTQYEQGASRRARHRAIIMQIVNAYPGLTTQQIIVKESQLFGYQFLTDNRLRELRKKGWVKGIKEDDDLLHWYPVKGES